MTFLNEIYTYVTFDPHDSKEKENAYATVRRNLIMRTEAYWCVAVSDFMLSEDDDPKWDGFRRVHGMLYIEGIEGVDRDRLRE